MNCKHGFYTCINCIQEIESMCDTCEDGDNYEINDDYEMQELQTEV